MVLYHGTVLWCCILVLCHGAVSWCFVMVYRGAVSWTHGTVTFLRCHGSLPIFFVITFVIVFCVVIMDEL